jgi:hypothetical protein
MSIYLVFVLRRTYLVDQIDFGWQTFNCQSLRQTPAGLPNRLSGSKS